MKNNWSMETPPYLDRETANSNGECVQTHFFKVVKEEHPQLLLSCVSVRTDWSKDVPPYLNGEAMERQESTITSSVSLKSDNSKNVPLYFGNAPISHEKESEMKPQENTTTSSVSLQSYKSKEVPLYFNHERRQIFTTEALPAPTLIKGAEDQQENFPPPLNELHQVLKKHKSAMKNRSKTVSEGIPSCGNKTQLNKVFTNLYIIEGESKGINEEHEVIQMERRKEKHFQDTPINYLNIFTSVEDPKQVNITAVTSENARHNLGGRTIKTVLTKGIAGIGKTISVQKFILDWAEGNSNHDIDFIFVFPFRELNLVKHDHYSLHKLICDIHPEIQDANPEIYNNHNVLFIFDGLDESRLALDFLNSEKVSAVTTTSTVGVLMSNLIRSDLLPLARIWITSRPAAANQVPFQHISRVTEIQGFSDPQKEEYFTKKISDKDLAVKIISHVKKTRSLYIMCHIPIFCLIAATVLEELMKRNGHTEAPKTLAEIYVHFLLTQACMKNQKYEDMVERDPQILLENNQITMLKLAKLAFKQLMMGNVMFYKDDLKECGIDITDASVYFGICTQIFKKESVLYQKNVYSFVHLSFQEFFAALYTFYSYTTKNMEDLQFFKPSHQDWTDEFPLDELLKAAVNTALQSDNGQLDLFLRFLLGISLESNQTLLQGLLSHTQNSAENIQTTVRYIKWQIETEDLATDRSINLFLCLTELKDQSLAKEIWKYLNSEKPPKVEEKPLKKEPSEKKLSAAHCTAIAYMLQVSENVLDELDLKRFDTSQEGRGRLIPAVSNCRNAQFAGCHLTTDSYETITSALQSENSPLRELDLSNNDVQDLGVKLLCAGLKSPHCNLHTLRLCICNLWEKACAELGSVLSMPNSPLRELDLSNNEVQDSGVKLLCDGLKSPYCNLHKLRLSGCSVTAEGCSALASVLSSNSSHLKELDLNYNHSGESGVKLLSARLEDPSCKLETLSTNYGAKDRIKPGLRKYARKLTLDPNTANTHLTLSEGNRKVTQGPEEHPYPDHPERFEFFKQVMCKEGLSGRSYLEAEWTGGNIVIAMSYKDIPRKGGKGNCVFGSNDKSWKLDCSSDSYTAHHNKQRTDVPAPAFRSNRVGVYLDQTAGILSFYSISSDTHVQTHLHTYYANFTEPLYAGFWVDIDTSVCLCQME